MKKTLLSMAAVALLSLAANAQGGAPLYATGDFEASNWNPSEPVEFAYEEDMYKLEIADVSMLKISTVSGAEAEDPWAAFNGGALNVADGAEIIPGKEMALTAGDANIVFPWRGEWQLFVSSDLSTILATTTTPAPEGDLAIYVRGGMNDWGVSEDWQMKSFNGDYYYLLNVVIPEDVEWKIADADWAKVNYGVASDGEMVVLDEEFELEFNGKNIMIDYAGETPESVDIVFQLSTHLVAVSAHEDVAPLYATGDFEASNWNPSEPIEFVCIGGDYAAYIKDVSMLKVSTISGAGAEDPWAAFNEGALQIAEGVEVVADDFLALVPGDANIVMPWRGDWTVAISDDMSEIYLSTTTPAPTSPADIYLRGGMNDWGTDEAWKFETTDGNVYTLNNVTIADGEEWKVADADWSKINYGVAEAGEMIVLDEPFELAYNGANITIDYLGETVESLNIVFTLDDHTIILMDSAGIADITFDKNAPRTYYNLQGVEVANPTTGLYIIKQGNATTKAYIIK